MLFFKSNLCFLFILYRSIHFCLTYRQSQESQPLLEVIKVLRFLCPLCPCQSTDHPGWLSPQLSRREKIRMWLLLGWRLVYTIATVSISLPSHLSSMGFTPSPHPSAMPCLSCGLWKSKISVLTEPLKVLTQWWFCFLHIHLWSTQQKELDYLIFRELDNQTPTLL